MTLPTPPSIDEASAIRYLNLLDEQIGSGAFGKVFTSSNDASELALKKLDVSFERSLFAEIEILNFIREQQKINERGSLQCLTFVGWFERQEGDRAMRYIITKRCKGGHLSRPYSLQQTITIMKQLLEGVAFLHRHDIMHLDLKPDNIMFDEQDDINTLKIIDFGVSHHVKSLSGVYGTPEYRSPEMKFDVEYTNKTDIFSLGVIFHELLKGRLPHFGSYFELLVMERFEYLPRVNQILRNSLTYENEECFLKNKENINITYRYRFLYDECLKPTKISTYKATFTHERKAKLQGVLCLNDIYVLNSTRNVAYRNNELEDPQGRKIVAILKLNNTICKLFGTMIVETKEEEHQLSAQGMYLGANASETFLLIHMEDAVYIYDKKFTEQAVLRYESCAICSNSTKAFVLVGDSQIFVYDSVNREWSGFSVEYKVDRIFCDDNALFFPAIEREQLICVDFFGTHNWSCPLRASNELFCSKAYLIMTHDTFLVRINKETGDIMSTQKIFEDFQNLQVLDVDGDSVLCFNKFSGTVIHADLQFVKVVGEPKTVITQWNQSKARASAEDLLHQINELAQQQGVESLGKRLKVRLRF